MKKANKAKKVAKEHKKKRFSLWRTLAYVGCYVLVTFVTAFIVVAVNSSTYSFSPPKLNGGGEGSSSLLGNVVSNIMSMTDLEGSLNLAINDNKNKILVDGDIEIVLYEEFSGVELKGDLDIQLADNTLKLNMLYKDNMYIVLNGNSVVLDTDNAIEGIVGVLALYGVDFDLDMGALAGSLDMSILDTLGEYITEKTTDTGYELIVDYNGLQAVAIIDKEYNIDKITLPSMVLGDTTLSLEFDIQNTNQGISFELPEDSGVDITPLIGLAKSVINFSRHNTINFDVDISNNQYFAQINGLYNNGDIMLLADIMGEKFDLYYKDKMAYVDCGFAQIQGNYADLSDLINQVYDLMPSEIKEGITNIDMPQDFDITSSLFGALTLLNDVEWDIIEKGDNLAIQFENVQIDILQNNNDIEKISVHVGDLVFEVQFDYFENSVVVPEIEYILVSDLSSLIRPIYNVVTSKNFGFDLTLLDIKTQKVYAGKLAVNLETLQIDFCTNLYNKDIKLNYFDENIYLQIDGVKVSTHQNNIFGLILYLAQNYQLDLSGIQIFAENDVIRLEENKGNYSFAYGDIEFDFVVQEDYITSINTTIEDLDICGQITYNNDVCFDVIDKNSYTQLDLSQENLQFVYDQIIDYIEREEYNFDFEIKLDDFDLQGYVGYNKGDLKFDFAFDLLSRPVRIVYNEGMAYLFIDNNQIKCDIDTMSGILGYVLSQFDFDMSQLDVLGEISLPSIEDIEHILENVGVSFNGNKLNLTYEEIFAQIQLTPNGISGLALRYKDLNAKLTPTYNKDIEVPNTQYINIEDVVALLNSVQNIIERKYGSVDFALTYKGIEITGQTKLDLREDIKCEGDISLFGKTLHFIYENEKLYITYDGVKISADVMDILTWKNDDKTEDSNVAIEGEKDIYATIFHVLNSIKLVKTSEGFDIGVLGHMFNIKHENGEIVGFVGSEMGVDFDINFSHEYPLFTNYNSNDYRYLNISRDNILSLKDNIVDYIESEKYYFNLAFEYAGYEVVGYVEYEQGKLGFDFSTTLLDNQLNIVLIDEVVYVSYANVKINCSLEDLEKVLGYILEKTELEFPELNIDFTNQIDINIDSIQEILSYISLGLNNDTLSVDLGECTLYLDLNNCELNSIVFNGFDVLMSVNLVEKRNIILPEGEYVNLDNIYSLLKPIENLISKKYASMTYALEYSGLEIIGMLNVDVRETLRISGTASLYGKTLHFDYINGMIYISVDNMKVCTKFEDLLTLKEYLNLDENKDVTLDDIVREENNLKVDKTQNESNDVFTIGFANVFVNLLVRDGDFVGINIDEFGVCANIQILEDIPVFADLKTSSYQYIDITYDNIEKIIDSVENYVDSNEYYFDICANIGEYNITGWIGYNFGDISAYLSTTVISKKLEVVLLSDIIYIDFDGLKLQCALADIDIIINLLKNEFGVSLPEIQKSNEINISDYISKILLSNNNMILGVSYDDIRAYIDFSGYTLNTLRFEYDGIKEKLGTVSAVITPCMPRSVSVNGKYLNIASLTDVVKAVKSTMSEKTISGDVDLYINFGGEQNILELDYGVKFANGNIEAKISTTFKGIEVDIYLIDKTLYLDIAGMKIYVQLSEYADVITWLNQQFDLNIDLENLKEMAGTSIEDFSFDFLNSWIISNKYIQANIFNGLIIDVYYDTLINKVVFSHGDIRAELYCTSFDEFSLDDVNPTEYSHYTIVANTIDDVMATINKTKFDITANSKSYQEGNVDEYGNRIPTYDVDLKLQISFADILALYGSAIVNDTTSVEVSWEQVNVNGVLKEYAYVNYDGMKVCAEKDSLIEIAAVICQVLGVDISNIKLFENIGEDFIVETDNFAGMLPAIELGNPLNLLQYIKSLKIEKGVFTLVLKGDLVGENINDMTAKLYTNNGTIYRLELRDINVGGGETFDLTIDLNNFEGVGIIEDKTGFYDLSSSSQLVKAFINTSTLKDYHLVGDVNLGLAGIDGLVKVGVDVKVQKDENNKLTAAVQLSGFPLVSSITDKNTNHASSILTILGSSYRTRTINIYMRDGYAYLMTDDEEFSSWGSKKDRYVRATKIPLNYLLNNIEYYMQYLMGFADNIQKEINNAIAESKNFTGETDYSDILKGYEYKNLTHNLQLNLEEIAHNSQLGIMEVDIITKSNASTNHKDYLYELGLKVSFLDLINISTSDNNRLELVDIGQKLDMSAITNYIDNYNYNIFGEYIKSGSGAYSQSNSNNVTLTFHQNQGYDDLKVSGTTGSYFNLPTPTCMSYVGSDGKEYTFNGWYYYTNTNKTKSRQWTENYLPKDNMELFGSWEERYQLQLIENNTLYAKYNLFEDQEMILPEIESYFVEVDGVAEYHQFLGWYDGLKKYVDISMPKKNLNLYAKWDIYNYYTINFVNNGETYESLFLAENSVVTISELNNYTATIDGREVVYKWCGWYNGDERVMGSYVLDGDTTLIAKWEEYSLEQTRVFSIYDGDILLYSGNQVVGQEIVMPNNVRIEESTLWYTDRALTNRYNDLSVMPNQNLTLYICNQFDLTIEYSEFKNGRRNIIRETHKVYQNADISSYFVNQVSGSFDDGTETKCVYYNFLGWNDNRTVMPNEDITISADWSVDTKYYFTVVFDTTNKPDGRDFYVSPSTPDSIRLLEGTTLNLNSSKYEVSCQTRRWVITYKYYNYKSDGWSYTSSQSTNGGGVYSIVVDSAYAENGEIKLYPCWKSV